MTTENPLLLVDTREEYTATPETAAEPIASPKENWNVLYWRTRALRLEIIGTWDNVETLTQGLERVRELARQAAMQEGEEQAETIKRIRFFADTALRAVWGEKGKKP